MINEILKDYDALMREAPGTVDLYLSSAVERIDARFGDGYAKKHPELVGAFIQACALDFLAGSLGKTHQDTMDRLGNLLSFTLHEVFGDR